MNKSFRLFTLLLISLLVILSSCNKQKDSEKYELDEYVYDLKEDFVLGGEGKFEKVITKPLVKPDNCRFIVSGTIEYMLDGEVVAIIDYGDGTCDIIVTKTVNDSTTRFELDSKVDYEYRKVIAEPLVKIEGCDYIVSGVIEFYKEGKWLATIDFGDGTCDNIAVKIWEGGHEEFRLSK
jgi:hypothetical protein